MRRFRRRRMREFMSEFEPGPGMRVLDVGGTASMWKLAQRGAQVILLNMPREAEAFEPGFWTVAGDACALPFRDHSVDVVFSNSVIEHVGSQERQQQFAAEVRRVGRSYWVQTPNRWFPVEAHLLMPFVHWLPRRWQAAMVRRFSIWELVEHPSEDRRTFYIEHYLQDVRLLDAGALARLFPDAEIRRERFLGWTKSLIAVKSRATS